MQTMKSWIVVAVLLAILCSSHALRRDQPDSKTSGGGDPLDPMVTGSMISGSVAFARDTPDGKGNGDPLDPMVTGSMISGGAVFLEDQPEPKTPTGGDPLDPMVTGTMISGGAVFLEDQPEPKTPTGGDPLDPMVTGTMISGGAVFLEDQPEPKTPTGGDPLDPMVTGTMISGGAVFDKESEPALVENDASIGPTQWVDSLIKQYMSQAKAGKLKGANKGDVKVVDNTNSLTHHELEGGVDGEERFKKTQEESKKASAEQKAKEQDEMGQKKVEQATKTDVVALKKQIQEQNLKVDREQDKKTVQEQKLKASEADVKKKNEASLKKQVEKIKASAAEEGIKAQAALEKKKRNESSEKQKMEAKTKREIQDAVRAAAKQRERAAKEAQSKREAEASLKTQQRKEEQKKQEAKQKKHDEEEAKRRAKEQEERDATVRPNAFKISAGLNIAESSRLLPNRSWRAAYTLTFWISPAGIPGVWNNILHKGGNNVQRNPSIFFYPGQPRLHVRSGTVNHANNWSGGVDLGCDPARALPVGSWSWVGVMHDAQHLRVVFGTPAGDFQTVCTAQIGAPGINNGPLYASSPFSGGQSSTSQLSDVRMYNRILSDAELKEIIHKKVGITV